MSSYGLKSRRTTESKNPKVVKTENRRIILFNVQCVIVKN